MLRDEVPGWVEKNEGALSYFSTIQSFSRADKVDGETHWSPLFFDLDSEDKVAALDDARKLVDYFATGFEIIPEVWFSGNKGFHLVVQGDLFSAMPNNKLTYHWKHLAARIVQKLDVGTHDWRVYSVPRMWRIANTIHKSGRYKVPLDVTELGRGIDYILEVARSPRVLEVSAEEEDKEQLEPIEPLVKLYKGAANEYNERQKVLEHELLEAPVFGGDHPLCVEYLLENGLGVLGTKNRADMALANYCKALPMPLDEAEQFIAAWARSIPLSLTNIAEPLARIAQSMSVLKTVYSDPKYHFSCGSMRACELDINCKLCNVERESEIKEIRLADFAKAENHGRRVCVEADIVGKNSAEMIVPSKILGWCTQMKDTVQCARCAMGRHFNSETNRVERTIVFTGSESLTLQLLDVSNTTLHHRIKRIFGVEDRCTHFKYDPEWGNAVIVYLSTRISAEFKIEEQITRSRAIYLGHAIELNRGYKLFGYVWNHPRTNHATLIIDSVEPLQSSLATLVLADEQLERLKVFQPAVGQTPLKKIRDIHEVFQTNFVRVHGREELIMAVDIVFHSARRINFQKTKELRGWLDILVIGDTRQGKSDIAEKLMKYYGLGVMAAGETASRTGLLYTIHMISGEEAWIAFGLLCRANGYLVVIDEIHDMPSQDFKEFTLVRSSGVVDVKRAVFGAARAETRLISIANATPGKSLDSYGYPVQAIPDIPCFKALEDVSRFDYCVGVRAGDVDDDTINIDVYEIEELDNPYTQEDCRNLILWIWTREPDQINIQRTTEKVILTLAKRLSGEYISDIPLIEAADIRHKIARVATAVAGRLYSTKDGKTLVVTPAHAEAAYEIIDGFYKSPGLNYWGFSDDRQRLFLSPEKLEALRFDFKAAFVGWEMIARWLLEVPQFTQGLLASACDLSTKEKNQLIAFLVTNRFIATDQRQYIKTPSGRSFMRGLIENMKKLPPAKLQFDEVEKKEGEGEF